MLHHFKNTTHNTEIEGEKVEFHYPTIGDEIVIQSNISSLTRGHYAILKSSLSEETRQAAESAEMLATLEVCVTLPQQPDFSWRSIGGEEAKEFMILVYEAFIEWRSTFRKGKNKHISKKDT